jgi:hexosaminidase
MSRDSTILKRVLSAMLLMWGVWLAWLPQQGVAGESADAGLQLRWQVVELAPGGVTHARFTFTRLGQSSLPGGGWALYFNCIAGVAAGQPGIEQVSGTLFRIHSNRDLQQLAQGETLTLELSHPEIMVKLDKAPSGPYLVFDSDPGKAYAIHDYVRLPLERSKHLAGAPEGFSSLVDPADIYQRNLAIHDLPLASLPPVLPTPLHYIAGDGVLHLGTRPRIVAPAVLADESAYLGRLFEHSLRADGKARPVTVHLSVEAVPGQTEPEAYRLVIDPKRGIALSGNTAEAVFRGLQSLRQILFAGVTTSGTADLPAMTIVDAPRFAYRGLMVDVARNFQDPASLRRLIDLMAAFKLNKLHLHLSDDEGWRLQIKHLPELTGVGARRGHSATWADRLPPAYGSGPDPDDAHGSGFYSQDEYVDLLRYASKQHIEFIPEIEMPGHARAAVKAMAARYRRLKAAGDSHADAFLLSDPADRSSYRSAQLYTDNVIDPGLASSYAFIETVVGEIAALHRRAGVPLKTLHVGADELADGAWERSPAAQRTMSRLGLASTADLWDVFYDRVDAILRKHHIAAAGWEELGARKVKLHGQPGLIPNPHFVGRGFLLMVWNNLEGSEDLAYRLANAGYSVVLSPATNFYFDMAYNGDAIEPGVNWAAPAGVDLEQVYGFDPFDFVPRASAGHCTEELSDYGMQHIVGLEGALFSETVRTRERFDYLLMPRMLGLAERAWSPARQVGGDDWSRFANLVGKRVLPFLDADWPDLNYRIPPPGLLVKDGKVYVNHQFPGTTLRYTTTGETPSADSPLVTGPIKVEGRVNVAAFNRNGRSGRASTIDVSH